MSFNLVNVGIADIQIGRHPQILRTILGSCVGICLYDPQEKIAGLAHIMLPVMTSRATNPKKYADRAIPLLVEEMVSAGASPRRLIAKIVGGAMMFKIADQSMMGEIGKNNVAKTRDVLAALDIDIIAEDLYGDYGRTIDFFSADGSVKIKSIGRSEKLI